MSGPNNDPVPEKSLIRKRMGLGRGPVVAGGSFDPQTTLRRQLRPRDWSSSLAAGGRGRLGHQLDRNQRLARLWLPGVEHISAILSSINHRHCAGIPASPVRYHGSGDSFIDRLQRDAVGCGVVLCQETPIEFVGMSAAAMARHSV